MHVFHVPARTPQELIAQPDVDGMVSEPDPKVCRAEVCPVDDTERTARSVPTPSRLRECR